jgi:hypothetical protein
MSLLTLSAELLLYIASLLQQKELLNLSLTCKHLQSATESELFREYRNVSRNRRSFLPFLRRIVHHPKLGRYTRKLHLRSWTALDTFSDRDSESDRVARESCHERWEVGNIRGTKLTAADYTLLVQAARDTKLIQEIVPFDCSTCCLEKVDKTRCVTPIPNPRDAHAFDRIFCERLGAGSEDSLVLLLVALLPNVRDVVLDGVPGDVDALRWQPSHSFPALRMLIACATDGELEWPLAFFRPLLASGRLRILRVSHATSQHPHVITREPLLQEPSQFSSLYGTLALEQIELENCCLQEPDLRSLLQGCPLLKSFLYTGRRCEAGSWSPSPAEFVELLRSHETTLHTLILDLDVHPHEHKHGHRLPLIRSLAHMTGLKVLVTTPEMWHSVAVQNDVVKNDNIVWDERRLSVRLPPNVETLVFGLSEAEKTTSPDQLSDLVRMRTVMLPSLTTLSVGGIESVYVEEIKRLYLNLEPFMRTGPQELHAEVGPTYVGSVFDTGQCPHDLAEVRWTGQKYVAVPLETSLFARAYERIRRKIPR